MIYCENCGAAILIKGKFCEKCGHPLITVPANSTEGTPVPIDDKADFPGNPDYNLVDSAANISDGSLDVNNSPSIVNTSVDTNNGYDTVKVSTGVLKPKSGIKKVMIASVAGLVAVAIIVILILALNSGGSSDNILYLKSEKLYTYVQSEKKSYDEVGNLVKDSSDWSSGYKSIEAMALSLLTRTDEKGERLIYPQKISSSSISSSNVANFTYQLYWKELLNGDEVEKIDSSVQGMYFTDAACTHIFYVDDEKRLFQYDMSKREKTKIESDVHGVISSKDGNTILYQTESGMMYEKNYKKEKVKVASDVNSIIKLYDSGEAFYIEDDIMSEDGEKQLCYFDGEKSKKISELNKYFVAMTAVADNKPVVVFAGASDDIDSIEWYVANKASIQAIDIQNVSSIKLNSAGTQAMFLCDVEKDVGELHRVKISGSGTLSPELYDSEVADKSDAMQFLGEDDFVYYKDVSDSSGDLVINKKTVDYNVFMSVLYQDYDEKNENLYYITDIVKSSSGYLSGTLKAYNDGKTKKISDDASVFFDILPDGALIYLADYNVSNQRGDLCVYKNGKSTVLAEKIDGIVSGRFGEKTMKSFLVTAQKLAENNARKQYEKETNTTKDIEDILNFIDW